MVATMASVHRHSATAVILFSAQLIKVLSCGAVPAVGGGDAVGKRYAGLYTGPYYDPTLPSNISAQLGAHAFLPCKVRQLSDKSVSWIRRRDSHILTVGRYTFIADERFQSFLVEATDTWTLQVKYVQARDEGQYECQVGTEPKLSYYVHLSVVVPIITIPGGSDMFVKAGSTASIKCVVSQSLEAPGYIFWFHNERRVLGIGRVAELMERLASNTTVGNLIIHKTRREDSGKYTCAPANLGSASVVLHVLSGEHPAAVQHDSAAARAPSPAAALAALLAAMLLISCHDEEEVRQ